MHTHFCISLPFNFHFSSKLSVDCAPYACAMSAILHERCTGVPWTTRMFIDKQCNFTAGTAAAYFSFSPFASKHGLCICFNKPLLALVLWHSKMARNAFQVSAEPAVGASTMMTRGASHCDAAMCCPCRSRRAKICTLRKIFASLVTAIWSKTQRLSVTAMVLVATQALIQPCYVAYCQQACMELPSENADASNLSAHLISDRRDL